MILLLALGILSALEQARGDWIDHWESVPSSALPAQVPDGDLKVFIQALERQKENCREFQDGKFNHCAAESQPVNLVCDNELIDLALRLAKESRDWKSFYEKSKTSFDWFRYKIPQVQFTGYNTPLFSGSLTQDSQHRYPAFDRPADLVDLKGPNGEVLWKKKLPDGSLVNYDDRKAIDLGHALDGKAHEVAYFEFTSDLLRLQIEGAGVLEVRGKGGEVKQYGLGFAGKNGLPFVSVFKYLRDKGVDKKYLSFPGLKKYFHDFPDDMWPTLVTNPSYVFFSLSEEPPCGTARVYLSGGHSLATDPAHLPLGSLAFFTASRPVPGSDPEAPGAPSQPFSRFAFAQDTGGAIQGAHIDVYWGTDDYAQLASNLMNSKGALFLPRSKKH